MGDFQSVIQAMSRLKERKQRISVGIDAMEAIQSKESLCSVGSVHRIALFAHTDLLDVLATWGMLAREPPYEAAAILTALGHQTPASGRTPPDRKTEAASPLPRYDLCK